MNQNRPILELINELSPPNQVPLNIDGKPMDSSAFGAPQPQPVGVVPVSPNARVFNKPEYGEDGRIINPDQDEKPPRFSAKAKFPNLPSNLEDQPAQFKFLTKLKHQLSSWDIEDPSYRKLQNAFPWNKLRPAIYQVFRSFQEHEHCPKPVLMQVESAATILLNCE